MTRTVISQTDLAAKASEVVERVRHGEIAVVETSGEEQVVLLDAADFRLLQALAACATEPPEPTEDISHDALVLRRYLNTEINLGKAAEELGLSRLELQDRFLRLEFLSASDPPRWRKHSARSLLSRSVPEPARFK